MIRHLPLSDGWYDHSGTKAVVLERKYPMRPAFTSLLLVALLVACKSRGLPGAEVSERGGYRPSEHLPENTCVETFSLNESCIIFLHVCFSW